jgi:hypothetical protein
MVHEGKLTNLFEVTRGVRQGCILPPTLFLLVLDNVMNKVIKGRKRGIQWRMMKRLENLDFVDDIWLLAQRSNIEKLEEEEAKVGLRINEFKTKKIKVNPNTDLVLINGKEME